VGPRRRTRNGSSSTAGAFLVVLLVIGLVIKFIWIIVAAVIEPSTAPSSTAPARRPLP
jgi:hypothetical protein